MQDAIPGRTPGFSGALGESSQEAPLSWISGNGKAFFSPYPYPPFIKFVQYKEQDREGYEEQEILGGDIGGVKDILDLRDIQDHVDPDDFYDDSDEEQFIRE